MKSASKVRPYNSVGKTRIQPQTSPNAVGESLKSPDESTPRISMAAIERFGQLMGAISGEIDKLHFGWTTLYNHADEQRKSGPGSEEERMMSGAWQILNGADSKIFKSWCEMLKIWDEEIEKAALHLAKKQRALAFSNAEEVLHEMESRGFSEDIIDMVASAYEDAKARNRT